MQILAGCETEELPTNLFLVGNHASLVLEKDCRLCHTSYAESMSPDSGSESDDEKTKAQDSRVTTFLFWINKKVKINSFSSFRADSL